MRVTSPFRYSAERSGTDAGTGFTTRFDFAGTTEESVASFAGGIAEVTFVIAGGITAGGRLVLNNS